MDTNDIEMGIIKKIDQKKAGKRQPEEHGFFQAHARQEAWNRADNLLQMFHDINIVTVG